jgi:hypothetical protein
MIAAVAYGLLAAVATLAVLSAIRPVDPVEYESNVRDGGIYAAAVAVGVIVGLAVGGVG